MNGDTNGTMGEPMDIAVPNEQDNLPELKKDSSVSLGNATFCVAAPNQKQENGDSVVTKTHDSIEEGKTHVIKSEPEDSRADSTDDPLEKMQGINQDDSVNIKDNGAPSDKELVSEKETNKEGSQHLKLDKPSKIVDSVKDMSKDNSHESCIKQEESEDIKNIDSLPSDEEQIYEKDNAESDSQDLPDSKPSIIDDPLMVTFKSDSNKDSLSLKQEYPKDTQDDEELPINNDSNEDSMKSEDHEEIKHSIKLQNDYKQASENNINENDSENIKESKSIKIEDPLKDTGKDDIDDGSIKKADSVQPEPIDKSSLGDQNSGDGMSHLSIEGSSKNGIGSTNNSKDSSVSGDDPMGDTMLNIQMKKASLLECSDLSDEDNGSLKTETFKIVTISKNDSDEEVESIHSSDFSSDGEHKIEDAVSIHSDSDDVIPQEDTVDKSNDVIILEIEGTNTHNGTSKSNEVHEIVSDNDNDDCVVTAEEKASKKSPKKGNKAKSDNKVELRRSSRTVKRKKYDVDVEPLDDESDIEEVILDDPLKRKSNKNNYSYSKSALDLTGKNIKGNVNQRKDSMVIIIDSPVKNRLPMNKSVNSALNQSIYQRMASRGTSVTPISVKSSTSQATQVVQPPPIAPPSQPILPTLTDDMFVVEAPSFIVPYVYEKPADVPFKEFVDKWGKEIEEEIAKEEQALLEKKKEEKLKREQEKKEKKERGEEVEESEEEVESEEVKKKKAEKAEKKERRRRKKEDDDVSWDGSSSEESEDDSISDEDSQSMNLKNKIDAIDEIKNVSYLPAESAKSDSYFDLFLGKFFMNIGMNLVQEYVQTDLLKQQNRKLQRVKRAGHDTAAQELSVGLLTKNLELSQKSNASFTFEQKKCRFCTFKTESALSMAHHMETPHMKNNLYHCNYCPFEIKSAHDILFHMDKVHNVKGKLERAPALHQCANCPFEDHGKGKLARHLIACAKKFKPDNNLAPPVEWEHPAKIAKVMRPRHNATNYQVAQFGRHHVDSNSYPKLSVPMGSAGMYRGRARAPPPPRLQLPAPVQVRPGGVLIRHYQPQQAFPAGSAKKSSEPSISITPLPRQPSPLPVQPLHTANAKGFVICEICDGYIKDLEQLRHHMQWIHKVKIHPKMIYNRPPLNCQKCQFRFFTDQGLERHLLGSHGLVTSSMQEAANKGKDAGRCPVCGRVYQWKLLGHVSRDHNLILKPAHLSYKCTVCTATFGMYRQFENHVYSAHSVVAKKVIDKKTNAVSAKAVANDNAAKQLKINDEITIIPQPVKTPAAAKGK